MKSRSKVTKRQKVRRTSEMALRSAGGTNRYCGGRDRDVEYEAFKEAMAGRLPPSSPYSPPGIPVVRQETPPATRQIKFKDFI